MSALDHIGDAIHALRSAEGAIDGRMQPGSRSAKAVWYLQQAQVCLQDEPKDEPEEVTTEQPEMSVPAPTDGDGQGTAEAPAAPPEDIEAPVVAFTTAVE